MFRCSSAAGPRLGLFFSAILLALSLAGDGFTQGSPLGPAFDSWMDKALRDWKAPGVMISVVRDGKVVYAGGYGVVKAGETRPVDHTTLCPIMSNSKAFTATALAMLVDEGKLSWDDPVRKYIPDFRLLDPWVERTATIRDVLCHRAGFPIIVGEWDDPAYTRDSLIRALRYTDPGAGFREGFLYSNMGYVIAGQIIQRLTGKTWEQFVRERILTPLEMNSSFACFTEMGDVSRRDNLFPSHSKNAGTVVPMKWNLRNDLYPAAAGIVTTADDIAKWMIFQLGDGSSDGKRLVSPERLADIHTPQMLMDIPWSRSIYNPELHFSVYDLGFASYDYRGRKVDEHLGGDINSIVSFIPEEHIGVAVCTNAAFGYESLRMASAIKLKIFDILLGSPSTDWSAVFREVQRKADSEAAAARKDQPKTAPSLALAKYAGTYSDPLRGPVRVALENGKLTLRYRDGYIGDLESSTGDTFKVVWRGTKHLTSEISFRVTNGRADALVWRNLAEFERK